MLSLIVALAPNNAIGFQQQLLWKISEDLQYFKRTTTGHCVIMGRKTFESIGRPLPNRRNIVISRSLTTPPMEGIEVADSLPRAISLATQPAPAGEIFIMGGGEIYRQALPLANKLYITHVKAPAPQADVFFPRIDWRQWKEIFREEHEHGAVFPYPFSFVVYDRALMQHNYNTNPFDIYS
ncbi:MAG: dihydrofolate reductase [Bacteroidales bacterium]|nr:dihydrofolate reductase [Bacteroidales bacterium]MCL2738505.1 dihydrofolate reductase [Bacteroidales bacterium]